MSAGARAAGRIRADVVDVARSGMASMPGAAAPAVVQPLAPAQGDGDDEDGETAGPGGGESAGSEEERGAEK